MIQDKNEVEFCHLKAFLGGCFGNVGGGLLLLGGAVPLVGVAVVAAAVVAVVESMED